MEQKEVKVEVLETDISFQFLEEICEKHKCTLEGKTSRRTWLISSDNEPELLKMCDWFGLNIVHRSKYNSL